MLLKIFVLFFQSIIIFNLYFITNAKSLTGQNIKHPKSNDYHFLASIIGINPYYPAAVENKCIGTFISKKDVITAAHCVQNARLESTQIAAGSTDFRRTKKMPILWWYTYNGWMEQRRLPPEFSFNDMAIIRLKENAPSEVTYISVTKLSNEALYGKRAVMASWNAPTATATPSLDLGEVKIMSIRRCNEKLKKINQPAIHSRYLCSQNTPYMVMEPGDSGGPLIYKKTIIGINSGFYPHDDNYPPDGKINCHVGIEYYKPFILSVLNIK